jgi:hypothetical protein
MGTFRYLSIAMWVACALFSLRAHAESALGLRMFANATTVKRGDSFQLDVVLSVNGQDAVDEFDLPDLTDFAVLRESESQQASFSTIGGRRAIVVEHRRTFVLQATEAGTKQIGEATARLGGTTARAAPIAIRVVGGPAGKPKAQDHVSSSAPASDDTDGAPPAVADEAAVDARAIDSAIPGARFGDTLPRLFAELRVDKAAAFIGEQITVVGEVYSQVPLGQYPRVPGQKPAGFACLPIDDGVRPQASQRVLQGRAFYVYPLTRDALFGLQPGKVDLAPLEFEVSPSGSFFSRSQDVRVRSAAVTVDVKPLPEPAPPGFHAENVGHIELRASVRPTTVKLGEPFALVVEVVGWGNTEGFVLPQWAGDGSARIFPPTARRERRDSDGLVAGRVVEETLIQPARAGRVVIPSLTMVVFDPAEGRYVTRETAPLAVVVGAGGAAAPSSSTGRRQTIAAGARPLALDIDVRQAAAFGLAPVFGGAVAALGVLTGVLGRRRRTAQDSVVGQRDRRRRERAAAALKARAAVDVAAAHRLLLDALAERCGDDVRASDSQALPPLLMNRGLSDGLATDVVTAIVAAEAARFAPGGAKGQAVEQLLARLVDVDVDVDGAA